MALPRLWPLPLDKCMVSSQAMLCIYLFRGPINYARQPNDGRALYAANEMNQFDVISLLCDHKDVRCMSPSIHLIAITLFVSVSSSFTSVNYARPQTFFAHADAQQYIYVYRKQIWNRESRSRICGPV